jgi:hypothetical protein
MAKRFAEELPGKPVEQKQKARQHDRNRQPGDDCPSENPPVLSPCGGTTHAGQQIKSLLLFVLRKPKRKLHLSYSFGAGQGNRTLGSDIFVWSGSKCQFLFEIFISGAASFHTNRHQNHPRFLWGPARPARNAVEKSRAQCEAVAAP